MKNMKKVRIIVSLALIIVLVGAMSMTALAASNSTHRSQMRGFTVVREGSKNNNVRLLQTFLEKYYRIKLDDPLGTFGLSTKTAVKIFQSDKGLSSDGICGANTWGKIYDALIESQINSQDITYKYGGTPILLRRTINNSTSWYYIVDGNNSNSQLLNVY